MAKGLNLKMILLTLTPCSSPSLIAIKGSKTYSHYKILANYNGQAELLLSLQIPPDYFPYQFKQRSLYDYLTHINKYLVVGEQASEEKKEFSEALQTRIDQLVNSVTTFGPSLWNEDLYAGGLVNRNVQFWNTKSADYLFLEQFIVDDSSDPLFLIQRLPKHSHVAITNFRAARDPYSLFGEEVYRYFRQPSETTQGTNNAIAQKLYEYYKNYSKITINNLYRSARYIEFWNEFCSNLKEKATNGNKDDFQYFFKLPNKEEKLFAPFSKNDDDKYIAEEFLEAVFTDDERAFLNKDTQPPDSFKLNYLNGKNGDTPNSDSVCPEGLYSTLPEKVHHPALEHQIMKGSSPVSEGTQKELFVYLAQMAIALHQVSKTTNFETVFATDSRKEFISKAWDNAVLIAKNYRTRLKNIREYLKKINVVDSSFDPEKKVYKRDKSKTLAIISYPPSQLGAGDASIQTVSKYPFLYTELGLKEVIPKNLSDHETREKILGVDDNGWWWRLGDFNFSRQGLDSFSNTADSIILLATEDDWNILNVWDNPKLSSLSSLLKQDTSGKKALEISSYHLWNEGLRSPIALNLLLDVLVNTLTKQFGNGKNLQYQEEYKKALEWGDYWTKQFVKGLSADNSITRK